MTICPRDSIGLIAKKEDRYLMLERLKHPVGLACVAGHLDIINDKKESFETASFREWAEETGSKILTMKLVLENTFPNPCKSGYNGHNWQVFEVLQWKGEPHLTEPDKHGFIKWMSVEEIKQWIALSKPTDLAWFRYIFPTLDIKFE